jgi:hypothetical protein
MRFSIEPTCPAFAIGPPPAPPRRHGGDQDRSPRLLPGDPLPARPTGAELVHRRPRPPRPVPPPPPPGRRAADSAAAEHTQRQPFAGRTTPFERRFRGKRLPIYYVELTPRSAIVNPTAEADNSEPDLWPPFPKTASEAHPLTSLPSKRSEPCPIHPPSPRCTGPTSPRLPPNSGDNRRKVA